MLATWRTVSALVVASGLLAFVSPCLARAQTAGNLVGIVTTAAVPG